MTRPKKNDKDKYKDKDNDNDKDKDILRTHPKSNPRDLWPLRHLFRVMRRHDMTQKNWQRQLQRKRQRHFENNPRDLWHLIHWVQFWQLRTWIHDSLCYLTIKSTTGQHWQFLRCFIHVMSSHHSEQMSQRSQVSRIALRRCSQNVWLLVVPDQARDKVTYWAVLDS